MLAFKGSHKTCWLSNELLHFQPIQPQKQLSILSIEKCFFLFLVNNLVVLKKWWLPKLHLKDSGSTYILLQSRLLNCRHLKLFFCIVYCHFLQTTWHCCEKTKYKVNAHLCECLQEAKRLPTNQHKYSRFDKFYTVRAHIICIILCFFSHETI